jgi:hypothetical protein
MKESSTRRLTRSFSEFEKYLSQNPLEPFPEHVRIKAENSGYKVEDAATVIHER